MPDETPSDSLFDDLNGSGPAPSRASRREHRTGRRRRLRWILGGIGVFVLLVLGVGAFVGYRFYGEVKDVQASLEHAKAGMSSMTVLLEHGDKAQLTKTAASVTRSVDHAAKVVEGPMWNIAAKVPFVGQNVDAVQRVTRAVNILTDKALPPGLDLMAGLDLKKLTVAGGGINLEPFRKAQSAVPTISAAFAAAHAQIAPIDKASLMPTVAKPIDQILSIIDKATPSLDLVNRYLPTLLDLAGADGKKTYLLIFQNNAEIRATGGNPAASMIMTIDNGKLTMLDQADSQTFYAAGTGDGRYTPLPAQTRSIYRSTFDQHSQDFTMTPDFPTTALLFQNLWKHTSGSTFDGVISIDPVVLSNLLQAAGPVTLQDGEKVTSQNAVKLLLSDVYERFPNGKESDLFFADVASRVFTHLTSGSWDPQKMLDALTKSVEEQRVYLNFTDKKAQALAVELGVDGALQTDNKAKTQLGMYLNDSSVGKLEYHLTQTVALQCDVSKRAVTETITLHNSIPDSIRSSYTLGLRNGSFGLPRTTMMLDVSFFAPPGAKILSTNPTRGKVASWERSGVEKNNTAVVHTVFVPKNQTTTIAYTVQLPNSALGPLDLRYSPTARATKVSIAASCGQLFDR